MRKSIFLAVIAAIFLGIFAIPAKAIDVVGDNQAAAYIGTGALLLPSSFSGGQEVKNTVAGCLGCVWAYTVYCMYDQDGLCQHAVTGCPAGEVKYRVWFGYTAGSASVIGSVCWGSSQPLTKRNIENYISQLVINNVPPLVVTTAPPGGSLTVLPVVAWVNQEREFNPPAFSLSGKTVWLNAFASWRWIWGDGQIEWKSIPGAPYPRKQIWHTYRTPGDYSLNVTTFWQATYLVEGIGSFATSGEVVTQTVSTPIKILKARSVLVK